MKKRLLVLGMIACLFGLTACGNNESAQVLTEEEEAAAQVADSYISQIAQIEADGTAIGISRMMKAWRVYSQAGKAVWKI